MNAPVDCAGMRFGKLVAVSQTEPKFRIRKGRPSPIRRYLCNCDCGAQIVVTVPDLRSGNTESCGCNHHRAGEQSPSFVHGRAISVERGGKATTEYQIWNGMISRCERPSHVSYKLYGSRGIKVCARWRSDFMNFFSDMGPRPSGKHSIDRIDSNGDYEPGNCRWATGKEQFANARISPEFSAHINRGI